MQEEIDYGAGFIGLRLFVHACFTAQPCSGTVQRPVESTRNASARFGLFRSHTREKFGTLPGPRCMPSVSFHMLPRYSDYVIVAMCRLVRWRPLAVVLHETGGGRWRGSVRYETGLPPRKSQGAGQQATLLRQPRPASGLLRRVRRHRRGGGTVAGIV